MADDQDIERLIQSVTRAVLTRMGVGETPAGDRCAWLLLPVASGSMTGLARQGGQLKSLGYDTRVLAAPRVAQELDRTGLRGQFGGPVTNIEEANLGQVLSRLRSRDLVVIGSLGFELTQRICDLADQDPWVRMISQALMKKTPVILVNDDLSPGEGSDRLATRVRAAVRDLSALGIRPAALDDLQALILRISKATSTLSRAVGGLITETDVNQFAAEGEKRLRLPRNTVVTPLAWSRAAELGVEIVKEES